MTEEIKVSVGLDSSPMAEGSRKAQQALDKFKEDAEKAFKHGAGSPVRGFHRAIEEISEASPIMGVALKAALDPLTGIFAAAAVGIGFLIKKLHEAKEAADKAAEAIAAQWTKSNRAIHDAALEAAKAGKALTPGMVSEKGAPGVVEEWEVKHQKAKDAFENYARSVGDRKELEKLARTTRNPMLMPLGESQTYSARAQIKEYDRLKKEMEDAAHSLAAADADERSVATKDFDKKEKNKKDEEDKKETKRSRANEAEVGKLEQHAADILAGKEDKLKDLLEKELTIREQLKDSEMDATSVMEKQKELAQTHVDIAQTQVELQKQKVEEEKKAAEASKQAAEAAREEAEAQAQIKIESFREESEKHRPYQPTLDTLAKYNTPAGSLARREKWLGAAATAQYAMGNTAGAHQIEEQGIAPIQQMLEKAGILAPTMQLKSMEESLKTMVDQNKAARHVIVDNGA